MKQYEQKCALSSAKLCFQTGAWFIYNAKISKNAAFYITKISNAHFEYSKYIHDNKVSVSLF